MKASDISAWMNEMGITDREERGDLFEIILALDANARVKPKETSG